LLQSATQIEVGSRVVGAHGDGFAEFCDCSGHIARIKLHEAQAVVRRHKRGIDAQCLSQRIDRLGRATDRSVGFSESIVKAGIAWLHRHGLLEMPEGVAGTILVDRNGTEQKQSVWIGWILIKNYPTKLGRLG